MRRNGTKAERRGKEQGEKKERQRRSTKMEAGKYGARRSNTAFIGLPTMVDLCYMRHAIPTLDKDGIYLIIIHSLFFSNSLIIHEEKTKEIHN